MATDMEYTYLGDTGLEVSRLCLGCANFGSGRRIDEQWEWTVDELDEYVGALDVSLTDSEQARLEAPLDEPGA